MLEGILSSANLARAQEVEESTRRALAAQRSVPVDTAIVSRAEFAALEKLIKTAASVTLTMVHWLLGGPKRWQLHGHRGHRHCCNHLHAHSAGRR